MYWLPSVINLLALGALFTNHRLASLMCFFAYTILNLFSLFQVSPTDLDPAFFTISTLSTLAVYTALTAQSRDQVLTHQKKRASFHLLGWSVAIAFFFGHWMLSIGEDSITQKTKQSVEVSLVNGEVFMLLAVMVLWFIGKNLYDRR
jgi:hypothetical protein